MGLEIREGERIVEDIPRPEYPRPRFRRFGWTNLNGEWAFAFDDEDAGIARGWQNISPEELRSAESPFGRRIVVPYCYQARLSGIGEDAMHDVVWYARTFEYTLEDPAEWRLLLHFGAVDYRASVWVNGVRVAEHEGGHTPFCADVTDALREGENALAVRAEDPSRDVTIPRGKQYWKEGSEGIFYTRTTGIWQTVWLEPVSRRRVEGLRITPDVDEGCVDVEVGIEGFEPGMSLRLVAEYDGEAVVDDLVMVRASAVSRRLPLKVSGEAPPTPHIGDWQGAHLWSPEEPNLYDLRLELLNSDGVSLDVVESYFGLRKFETRGGEVYLNNQPYYQRLVLDQGYFPGGILTAPSDEELRRDIELAKEMGFNGARKHQKVEDPRWLYWADRLGFLVWGEMANAYEYSSGYVRRITAEWQEVIRRDYNHPCIVAWVPMNESWGVPRLASSPAQVEHLLAMYHLTRSLDGTRPVVSNDGWEHALTDLCTIHDYRDARALASNYATPEAAVESAPTRRSIYAPNYGHGGEPVLITEFGGIAFADEENGWGYSSVSDTEELLERYEALISALLKSQTVRGFCYTQLTDVEQETNGLLTFDRNPKADIHRIREITAKTL